MKKISVKKTRLLYSSLSRKEKPISEYVANVPNLIVVVELKNGRMVGAFTQSAFSRDLHSERIKVSSVMTKAMLMDITAEKSYRNQTGTDVIKHENNQLIWGKNEFALSVSEPYSLSCNLNCEEAVYPTQCKTSEFLAMHGASVPVTRFEVYRLFLG